MLPLNDTEPNRYKSFPVMTLVIIGVNIAVFFWEFYLVIKGMDYFIAAIRTFGTIPIQILRRESLGALTTITTAFLHGGLSHLIGNMFPLWVFGRRVEDVCGPWRFLAFYLTCGAFAEIAHILVHYDSDIPGIGASGAIAGLMGAYLILFPSGRIRALVLLPFSVPIFPRVRAFWIILYFLAWQIIPAVQVFLRQGDFYVAYWAHLGGFFSAAFILFFLRPEAFQRFINGAPM